jgi:hypothetical protein
MLYVPAIAKPLVGIVMVPLAGLAVDVAVAYGVGPSIPVSANTLIMFRIMGTEKLRTMFPLVPLGTAAINMLARWKLPLELSSSSTDVEAIPPMVATVVNVDVFRAVTIARM